MWRQLQNQQNPGRQFELYKRIFESMIEEKISIVTDEISQDLNIVMRFLDQHDLRAVEIRTLGGSRVPFIPDQVWLDLKKRANNKDILVLGLSPGIFKCSCYDESRIKHELEEILPLTIEQAVEIGADFIIAFGFLYDDHNQNAEAPNIVTEALRDAAGLCSMASIKLLLENEPGSFADTGERAGKLIKMVNHPNLFANWDPCNSNIFDNSEKLSISAGALGGLIKHVHVKDGVLSNGLYPQYCALSRGSVGWKEHLQALKDLGYQGWFGIETHFEPLYANSALCLSELRKLVKEINFWGSK